MLSVYAEIGAAYAETVSEGAIEILETNKIPYRYGHRVPMILDRGLQGACPYEQIVLGTNSPREAYLRIESKLR